MNHYPLVAAPEKLAGAEARINARPEFGYDWAIKYADLPMAPTRRVNVLRQVRSELYLEAKHHGGHTR